MSEIRGKSVTRISNLTREKNKRWLTRERLFTRTARTYSVYVTRVFAASLGIHAGETELARMPCKAAVVVVI